MIWVALLLIFVPLLLFVAAYLLYPVVLALLPARHTVVTPSDWGNADDWPEVTISVPVYNEAAAIRGTLESLLALDYPAGRRHIVVVSDASTDGTDGIVEEFADRGVTLIRLPRRGGKTAAENAVAPALRGTIVVNTDATIRIPEGSLKALVAAFRDPTVGVASGRDISVSTVTRDANRGESRYVGYEMWVRRMETRVDSIVGASGCFYGIRRSLFDSIFPEALSRDFASPLIAREHGYRSVSVDDATALVPRTTTLRAEYRRKVRTMTRGLETLWFKRHLLNPREYGAFAWMLLVHKLLRWMVFLALPLAVAGMGVLGLVWPPARLLWGGLGLAAAVAMVGLGLEARGVALPRPLAMVTFAASTAVAGFVAWFRALRGELDPVWEPTRRPETTPKASS